VLISLLVAIPVVALTVLASTYYTPELPAAEAEARYAVSASRYIVVDGIRLHVIDEGEGPAIVLLHGLTSNVFVYDGWAARLREYYRVVRVDLPGYGLTGPDPRGRYGTAQLADLVLALMDELGIERAHLAGNSLGGAVAWQVASRHPQRVDKLILISPVGYPTSGEMPLVFRLVADPAIGPMILRFVPEREFEKRLAAAWGDPRRLRPAETRRQFDLFRREGNRAALVDFFNAAGQTGDPSERLRQIRSATLILWGTLDRITPPDGAARFLADIPGADLMRLEGVGHVPMLEVPDESAAALRAFVAGPRGGWALPPVSARPAGRSAPRP
jgi:pimeloyl-ACP methyl ester carboxylesterase